MVKQNSLRTAQTATPGACARIKRRSTERGIVLLWATISVVMIAGVVFAATDRLKSVHELTNAEFSSMGQARAIARAGLTDAVAWLRRKTTQPVTNFVPERDPRLAPPDASATTASIAAAAAAAAANPITSDERPKNETEDANLGIVRSFEISPGLWGRYSVVRGSPREAWADTNGNGIYEEGESFTDTNGDGKWTTGEWTRDLTSERGLPGSGAVWFLACRGEVFARPNGSAPLGEGRNRRVAETILAMEVRRLTIAPPADAAVVANRGDDVSIGLRARLRGDTALAYASSTGSASTSGGELLGSKSPVGGLALGIEEVFGVTWSELKSMADLSTTDPVNGLPKVLPDFSLTVVTGDLTFDSSRPLRGNGVLVVKGNVTIESGSNSFFRGVLFVDGNFTARAPAYLRGTIMVTNEVDLRGTGGDFCEIEHDPGIVSLLLTHMGQYRISKAPFMPQARLLDGRATDAGISRRRFSDGGTLPTAP